ncbi:RING-H2 finger protein ATL74-like [Zingiber officinale]|uniref:RING-H2 finger protein ATL74-like n=1 Tax=Zingiber officinale TaxID=94328 RepID=UPI001C4D6F9E|nr:RING-H2 finger protein ATL74-like [Zingiber officinale]
MSGAEQPTTGGGDDGVVLSFATTNGFIVAAAMLLLILFIFSFILCLRAKRRWGGDPVAAAEDPLPQTSGLDAESMKALPWTVLRPDDFVGGADHCAVCLSEFSPGQGARVLPNCRHSFHVECIDGWFVAHTTCPLCRTQAGPKSTIMPPESPPANPSIPSAPQGAGSSSSFPSSERAAEALTSLRRMILRSESRSVDGPIDCDVEQGCVLPKSTPTS